MSAVREATSGAGHVKGPAPGKGFIVKTGKGPADSRFPEALIIAVNQAFDMDQWYTATRELQLASLEVCKACRSARTLPLRVDSDTPVTLLVTASCLGANPKRVVSSRVPLLRARRVKWERPSVQLLGEPIDAFAQLEEVHFDPSFGGDLEVRAWPGRMRKIEFMHGSSFNRPIVGVAWPATLEELTFERCFNQPIEGVTWPASLKKLIFGKSFNQAIEQVKWPASLKQLTFGLTFGHRFNQPIEMVKWPGSLQKLTLGYGFNHAIKLVIWPECLLELNFGDGFNQTLEAVKWPETLRKLSFGVQFNQSIQGVAWPTSLQELIFARKVCQPVQEVTWPTSLQELVLGGDSDPFGPYIANPIHSEEMLFRNSFNEAGKGVTRCMCLQEIRFRFLLEPIDDVTWPASLRRLVLGSRFNQPIAGVTWPTSLEQLVFGYYFNNPIDGVTWPTSLREVRFGRSFNQPIEDVKWPPSLRRLKVGAGFRQSLQKLGTALPSLERFALQLSHNSPVYRSLCGIEWPRKLTHLKVGTHANLDAVEIPPNVLVFYNYREDWEW